MSSLVTISEDEYNELQDRVFKLQCLENAGVDNWEGYDWAMEAYWENQED